MQRAVMEIEEQKEGYENMLKHLKTKNSMIKTSTGKGVSLQELDSKWREFEARLGAFIDKIKIQNKKLREEVDKRGIDINNDLQKFAEKWDKTTGKAAKDRKDAQGMSEMMSDNFSQWTDLEARIEQIYKDCKHYKKTVPQFNLYEQMKGELNKQKETWGMYD